MKKAGIRNSKLGTSSSLSSMQLLLLVLLCIPGFGPFGTRVVRCPSSWNGIDFWLLCWWLGQLGWYCTCTRLISSRMPTICYVLSVYSPPISSPSSAAIRSYSWSADANNKYTNSSESAMYSASWSQQQCSSSVSSSKTGYTMISLH